MARPKKKAKSPDEHIQDVIATIVVDSEYRQSASMRNEMNMEFESIVDILEGKRNEKDYDWMSDYSLPELISILQTDASSWVSVMFQSRDYCEVKLDGDTQEDFAKAKAAKRCLNKTLNDRDIFYYPKYVRLRLINAIIGECYILGWWEQKLKTEKRTHILHKPVIQDFIHPVTGEKSQRTVITQEQKQVEIKRPLVDHFNFDVIEPRNVFTDSKYCYTAQQKDWITIRSEASYSDLKRDEEMNQYSNLDKVKEAIRGVNKKSDTAKETYAKGEDGEISKTPVQYFDIIDRYGKFWAVVTERDSYDNPYKATAGLDEQGLPLEKAELIQMIITFVIIGSTKIMIRFKPTDYLDAENKPFIPICRGWCYVHPTKDTGLSDGKYLHQLQVAIDDNYNMGSDRTKLATLPTLIGNKNALDDNSTIYFEPEHVIEVNDVNNDLKELKISDDVSGTINNHNVLRGYAEQVSATYPTTMGGLPEKTSTTATAVAGADTRTNQRQNYKSMTFEYMFLQEFYWMILQMTYRFAHDETILKMLGEDAKHFDANEDYTYTPVTSNIESEYKKEKKIQLYDQNIGRLQGLAKVLPKVIPIISHMERRILELQGDEYKQIAKMLEDLSKSQPQAEPQGEDVKDAKDTATSNQAGVPMSTMEKATRNTAGDIRGGIQ